MATNNNIDEVEEVKKKEQESSSHEEYSPEILIIHSLQNTWMLWHYDPDVNKTWEENMHEIKSFNTARDFWSLYDHIKPASNLRSGSSYSVFKQGIPPMWQHNANIHGGRWLIPLERKHRARDLDHLWLQILLRMIGGAFNSHSDDVCGAVVNIRNRGDNLSIWTTDSKRSNSIMEIGRKLRERLRIASEEEKHQPGVEKSSRTLSMSYRVHVDSSVDAHII